LTFPYLRGKMNWIFKKGGVAILRLDKLISECGIASRREVALAARRGQVLVNGIPCKRPDTHINEDTDKIVYMGEDVLYRRFTYVMLNKPEGYISATEDGALPVVTELLPERLRRMGLFPSGRLDRDTVGLMILTNDGALSHKLLSPKHHAEKVYFYRLQAPLTEGAEASFSEGMTIGGEVCKPARLSPSEDRESGYVTLTEGKYHQVKRMFEALRNKVVFLERVSFGGVSLDRSLARGNWRYLTDGEIETLRRNG